jgi:protein-disulfide isomerase-like protein with CxxC motif
LVSDNGSIFKAKEAMRIYAALGIRKEQIDKKQAWQSYIETHFNAPAHMTGNGFGKVRFGTLLPFQWTRALA